MSKSLEIVLLIRDSMIKAWEVQSQPPYGNAYHMPTSNKECETKQCIYYHCYHYLSQFNTSNK
ncbi:MAG: hypothetical protein HN536_01130 [Candidatus Marinimicrobia bacterium]|nr:hypothetical protein [Candidatus Neomarinimicrobiota bacterium]MBT4737345.1 hypothetical protein [Candidatus Neomarinimicrobiota bacterium]MBT5776372.1 hypothetical protein [Candidatus Neomarinimicrobiota bacterium]MBT7922263.1 hypothetical protein [Candidatus Neomarinimicrobiota bacterium]